MSTEAPNPKPIKNTAATVSFRSDHREGGVQTLQAARPDVLLVLKRAEVMHWGWLVELRGTTDELVAAGVATPDMFEDLGKSGQKTAWTHYGNQYTVKKRKTYFELSLYLSEEPQVGEPSDPRLQKSVWWREHGGEIDAEVTDALNRIRRPRKEPRV